MAAFVYVCCRFKSYTKHSLNVNVIHTYLIVIVCWVKCCLHLSTISRKLTGSVLCAYYTAGSKLVKSLITVMLLYNKLGHSYSKLFLVNDYR